MELLWCLAFMTHPPDVVLHLVTPTLLQPVLSLLAAATAQVLRLDAAGQHAPREGFA